MRNIKVVKKMKTDIIKSKKLDKADANASRTMARVKKKLKLRKKY